MMRYLRGISADCQVFLTTHSTNFLDTTNLSNIYLISKGESTRAQRLAVEEAESTIPRELGLRMSSLFMYDRLVFVEGHTDEAIIRAWATVLGVNLSRTNVGFVKMGGSRNFSHYAATATLTFLAKRQVRSWILLDRDERNADEIAKFETIAGQFASVKVLESREIENYLLAPRAIVELIALKSSAAPDWAAPTQTTSKMRLTAGDNRDRSDRPHTRAAPHPDRKLLVGPQSRPLSPF